MQNDKLNQRRSSDQSKNSKKSRKSRKSKYNNIEIPSIVVNRAPTTDLSFKKQMTKDMLKNLKTQKEEGLLTGNDLDDAPICCIYFDIREPIKIWNMIL